jgi:MFS superfamily sulfate permease-like transporter
MPESDAGSDEIYLLAGCDTLSIGNSYMWLELLNFIIGIAFGFFHHGKEDYRGLLRNGVITGLVLGCIFVLISVFLVPGAISIGAGLSGVPGVFIIIILFVFIFIAGAFIGDRVEGVVKR